MEVQITGIFPMPTDVTSVSDGMPLYKFKRVRAEFIINGIFNCSCIMPICEDGDYKESIINKLKESIK